MSIAIENVGAQQAAPEQLEVPAGPRSALTSEPPRLAGSEGCLRTRCFRHPISCDRLSKDSNWSADIVIPIVHVIFRNIGISTSLSSKHPLSSCKFPTKSVQSGRKYASKLLGKDPAGDFMRAAAQIRGVLGGHMCLRNSNMRGRKTEYFFGGHDCSKHFR